VLDTYTVRFEPNAWFLDMLASTSTWIIARECVEKFGDLEKVESLGPGLLNLILALSIAQPDPRARPLAARRLRARRRSVRKIGRRLGSHDGDTPGRSPVSSPGAGAG
jgi:hypothetical protein